MNSQRMQFGLAGVLALGLGATPAATRNAPAPLPGVVLYKSALCGCCGKWADHLRAAGFHVTIRDVEDLAGIEARYGVPRGLQSCHTALAGGYLVVGHVPADVLQLLFTERPVIAGLSVPGMPQSAPGMDSGARDHFDVVAFDREGHTRVYKRR